MSGERWADAVKAAAFAARHLIPAGVTRGYFAAAFCVAAFAVTSSGSSV
jgi:hypothetical protein